MSLKMDVEMHPNIRLSAGSRPGAPLDTAGFRINTKTEKLGQHLVGLSLNFVCRAVLYERSYNTDEYLIFLLCFQVRTGKERKVTMLSLYLPEKNRNKEGI